MTTQTAAPTDEQAQAPEQAQPAPEEQAAEQPQPAEERLSRLEDENREMKALAAENNRILNEILDAFSQGTGSPTMLIHSIGKSGELLLRSPISVLIQRDDEEVLAEVPEFHVVGGGHTQPAAVDDAMTQLKELYEDLMSIPDNELGYLPTRWKRVLKALVVDDGAKV